jgi:hypothetical protein
MKYKPKSVAALHIAWWLAGSHADRGGAGPCRVCKDGRRTPQDDVVARKRCDKHSTGTHSRKRSKSEQGERPHPLPTETVERG